ncbi:alpha/beta fold hydrolase [Nocardiopsis sp. NPDC050513]|uniref:alpha/beta fold hydrolase n=1 Tax=Nocardiopsis sp. NPDC050513 TaxID=3364338 RepID=UPI0037BD3AE5
MTTDERTTLTEHTVPTSLGDLFVQESGSGPALVMLHGGGPGASGHSNYHQNLAALTPHFRVLLVDQPGFGRSHKPTAEELEKGDGITSYTVTALIEALDVLGVERAHVLGNSLGGAAALALALRAPERVDRLVLMAPGGGWLPFGATPTEGQKEMFRYYNGSGPSLTKMRTYLRVMLHNAGQIPEETLNERYESSLDPDHQAFYHVLNASFAARHGMDPLWRDVHRISSPTLLLWGRDDRTITLDGAQVMLKQIPDVRLHVFSRCGHWVQLERRREFDRLVADFLMDGGESGE